MNKYQLGDYVIFLNEMWEIIAFDRPTNTMRLYPRTSNPLPNRWVSIDQEGIIKDNLQQTYLGL